MKIINFLKENSNSDPDTASKAQRFCPICKTSYFDKTTENFLKMEQELISLKKKFEVVQEEKETRDFKYKEAQKILKDPESYVSQKLNETMVQVKNQRKENDRLQELLKGKESTIRNITVAHTQFKQQLESMKEELFYNQNEKENLSRKLNTIEKGEVKKSAHVENESLREQNKKLLQTLMKLLKSSEAVNRSTSKKTVKRPLSNSMKNSTVLLTNMRRLSSPSPTKKRKSSKRKIKKRKMSSGTRKSKLFKRGRNILTSETSPFSLMFNQMTPLVNNARDKNLQMYTQKFRTDKQDLHDAKAKINNLQKYINN